MSLVVRARDLGGVRRWALGVRLSARGSRLEALLVNFTFSKKGDHKRLVAFGLEAWGWGLRHFHLVKKGE